MTEQIMVTRILDALQASLKCRNRERDDKQPGDVKFWVVWLRQHASMVEDASQHKEKCDDDTG